MSTTDTAPAEHDLVTEEMVRIAARALYAAEFGDGPIQSQWEYFLPDAQVALAAVAPMIAARQQEKDAKIVDGYVGCFHIAAAIRRGETP